MDFDEARFREDVSFTDGGFEGKAVFRGAVFEGGARTLQDDARFADATFHADANFRAAEFRYVTFERAAFDGHAMFEEARFDADADFIEAVFAGEADCSPWWMSPCSDSRGESASPAPSDGNLGIVDSPLR